MSGSKDDGHFAGLHLPGAETPEGTLGGDPADLLGRVEEGTLARDVVPSPSRCMLPFSDATGETERLKEDVEYSPRSHGSPRRRSARAVGEVTALGIGDTRIHRERRGLAASGQLDLVLGERSWPVGSSRSRAGRFCKLPTHPAKPLSSSGAVMRASDTASSPSRSTEAREKSDVDAAAG